MAYAYRVNGETIRLSLHTRLVAIRFRGDRPLGAQARAARAWAACDPFGAVEIPDEDIAIMPVQLLMADTVPVDEATMAEAIVTLRQQADVAKVWPVFDAAGHPVLGTNRLVIGLTDACHARALADRFALTIVETRDDKIVCQVAGAADAFALIPDLEEDRAVRFVEPDLITIGNQAVDDRQPLPVSDMSPEDEPETEAASDAQPTPNGHQDALTALARTLGDSCERIARDTENSPLMAVRITPTALSGGRWKTTNTIIARSINWARRSGADIITHGWQGALPSADISEEFDRARRQGRGGLGCVMVAAPDVVSGLANVLGATARAGWACEPAVDEAAPASTTLSGACALILAANPELTEVQVRELVAEAYHGQADAKPRRSRPRGPREPHIDLLGAVQSALAGPLTGGPTISAAAGVPLFPPADRRQGGRSEDRPAERSPG
ncbi:MAG: hypothetical protein AAFX92_18570 [Pseudomonadota bacterium]